ERVRNVHPHRPVLLAEVVGQIGPRHQVEPGEFHLFNGLRSALALGPTAVIVSGRAPAETRSPRRCPGRTCWMCSCWRFPLVPPPVGSSGRPKPRLFVARLRSSVALAPWISSPSPPLRRATFREARLPVPASRSPPPPLPSSCRSETWLPLPVTWTPCPPLR